MAVVSNLSVLVLAVTSLQVEFTHRYSSLGGALRILNRVSKHNGSFSKPEQHIEADLFSCKPSQSL